MKRTPETFTIYYFTLSLLHLKEKTRHQNSCDNYQEKDNASETYYLSFNIIFWCSPEYIFLYMYDFYKIWYSLHYTSSRQKRRKNPTATVVVATAQMTAANPSGSSDDTLQENKRFREVESRIISTFPLIFPAASLGGKVSNQRIERRKNTRST